MSGRVYLDTSVLLSAFLGTGEPHHEDAVAAIASAQAGDYDLVISALVIAEAVGAPNIRAAQNTPREVCREKQAKVAEFISGLGATYVELGERHGRRAAEFSQAYDLKGKDALHLAAASESGCTDLFTCDGDLLKVEVVDGLRVRLPEPARQMLPFDPPEGAS